MRVILSADDSLPRVRLSHGGRGGHDILRARFKRPHICHSRHLPRYSRSASATRRAAEPARGARDGASALFDRLAMNPPHRKSSRAVGAARGSLVGSIVGPKAARIKAIEITCAYWARAEGTPPRTTRKEACLPGCDTRRVELLALNGTAKLARSCPLSEADRKLFERSEHFR
jgi:hypothetical protein